MKRSIIELLCAASGTCYTLYIFDYFAQRGDVGGAIAAALVTPHMMACALGSIFAWIAFFNCSKGLALTAAIMFTVAAFLFSMYAPLVLPMIVLGFLGYWRICAAHRQAENRRYDVNFDAARTLETRNDK